MASGLDGERLRKQWAEIDQLNATSQRLHACSRASSATSSKKAAWTCADDVLAEADWVVASVHYGQNQPREQITERILGAIENPHVQPIAHPTGRLHQPPQAVRGRSRRGLQAAARARQAAGAERQPGPARPGRRAPAPPPSSTAFRS